MTRTLRQTLVVARKELKDSLRDGRALFSIAFTVSSVASAGTIASSAGSSLMIRKSRTVGP